MSVSTTKAEPRKVRWTLPAGDVSVNEWLDAQGSISQSLRLLIRESIQRDGYIDVMNKPVEQLPRRGRPPQQPDVATDGDPEATAEPAAIVEPVASIPAEPAPHSAAASTPPVASPTSTQVDMNAIFGHNG